MRQGQTGTVVQIRARYGLACRLEVMGIRLGVTITKRSARLLRGPITVQVGGAELALGNGIAQRILVEVRLWKRVLLVGNANVGKSVVFSRLTGANVIASNYPGTTVEFTRGRLRPGGEPAEVIDVPGTYSLEPTSKAEEVATEMLDEGDVIINVVDASILKFLDRCDEDRYRLDVSCI